MATVTNTGVIPRDLAGYITLLQQRFRERVAADIDLSPEGLPGELIGIWGLALTEMDEAVVNLANGLSINFAAGNQLDDLGAMLNIQRIPASASTVEAMLSGVPTATIPAGSRARTSDDNDFETTESVQLAADGTASTTMRATTTGPVKADAGTLTRIITRVNGWEGVTNAAGATLGRNKETDADFRFRMLRATAYNASGSRDTLVAALLDAGAERIRMEENNTAAAIIKRGLVISPNSIMCIVKGGEDADVGLAILRKKALGVGMSGNTDVGGARFQRVTEVPIAVNLATEITTEFPGDGLGQIRSRLLGYSSTFSIGSIIDERRMQTPINAIPGHRITSLAVTVKDGGGALPDEPNLDVLYTLAEADISISTSSAS